MNFKDAVAQTLEISAGWSHAPEEEGLRLHNILFKFACVLLDLPANAEPSWIDTRVALAANAEKTQEEAAVLWSHFSQALAATTGVKIEDMQRPRDMGSTTALQGLTRRAVAKWHAALEDARELEAADGVRIELGKILGYDDAGRAGRLSLRGLLTYALQDLSRYKREEQGYRGVHIDRLKAMLDAERGIKGLEGWYVFVHVFPATPNEAWAGWRRDIADGQWVFACGNTLEDAKAGEVSPPGFWHYYSGDTLVRTGTDTDWCDYEAMEACEHALRNKGIIP